MTARLARSAWPLLALLLALAAWLLQSQPTERWDWQPALVWQQPWRWWSAAAVHWSARHLQMNLAGAALLAWLGWRAAAGWRASAAWALAWPLTQLGLLAQPALAHYGGLSGVLHAGMAVLAMQLLRRPGRERWLGGLIACGLLLKIATEQPWAGPLRQVPGWDFALAPAAHLSGALVGAACGLLLTRRDTARAAHTA